MSEVSQVLAGLSDTAGVRTSTRTRNKSQRALESKETNRILAKLKTAEAATKAAHDGNASAGEGSISKTTRKTRTPKNEVTVVAEEKAEEVYCICREKGTGSMIQCEECEDWFHYTCVGLTSKSADKIENYICPQCEAKTGQVSTMVDKSPSKATKSQTKSKTKPKTKEDQRLTSPKKPDDESRSEDDDQPETPQNSDSDDSGSDAAISLPSQASSSSPQPKRRRLSTPPSPKPIIDRKSSITKAGTKRAAASKKVETLLPARQYVMDKMEVVVKRMFGDGIQESEAKQIAGEIEQGIFHGFKDVIGGKEVAGVRYKAQFNLLNSSLSKPIRPSLLAKILSKEISPRDIAHLTSADLATEERLEELQKAKEASLASTVKAKEDTGGAVRFGRDGFEAVVDRDEEEMRLIREVEEANRTKEENAKKESEDELIRRESMISNNADETPLRALNSFTQRRPVSGSPAIGIQSPMVGNGNEDLNDSANEVLATFSPVDIRKPSESSEVFQSPTARQAGFSLTSAWGASGSTGQQGDDVVEGNEERSDVDIGYGGDQSALDLSDILADGEGMEFDGFLTNAETVPAAVVEEIKPKEKTEMEIYEEKQVMWSGGITNPAAPSPHTPPIALRIVSGRNTQSQPKEYWSFLLPQPVISITGRVPTKKALQYLSDSRLTPGKELLTVAFGLDSKATSEERKTWEEMIQYFIDKDRHAIFLPYDQRPPAGAAKELYLIPMRPVDSSPEFTDLIDGYSLPKSRTESVFLGVFVASKDTISNTGSPATPIVGSSDGSRPQQVRSTSSSAPYPPITVAPPAPAPTTAALPSTDQLQALLASIGPSTLPPLLGQIPPSNSIPPIPLPPPPTYIPPPTFNAFPPRPPGSYGQAPVAGYSPVGAFGATPPQPRIAGYTGSPLRPDSNGNGTPPIRQGSWGDGGRGRERSRSPDRGYRRDDEVGRRGGRAGIADNRARGERDNGWASRGGRGGRGAY